MDYKNWIGSYVRVCTQDGDIYEGLLTMSLDRVIDLRCDDGYIVCIPKDMIASIKLIFDSIIWELIK